MLLHSNILGEGKPFIILHGFLGSGDNWKTLGLQFSEKGYQGHLIDQRNHGKSFHDPEFNYDVMAKDLKHYCESYGLESIVLLGHSMGGKTAMLFATKYPEMVSKLVVADISPRYYPIHHDRILAGLAALDFNEITTRGQADKVLSQYVGDFGTRQFLLKNIDRIDKNTLGLKLNLEVLTSEVGEVGEPLPMHARFDGDTLFLRGDRSEYISIQDESIIKNHFPKAEVVTITNAGHWLHAENPTDFFNEVMQFLNK